MGDGTVSTLAKTTGAAFSSFVTKAELRGFHRPDEELVRYSLWAKEAGVADSSSQNIDQRLRRNDDVRNIVTQLLQTMHANLIVGMKHLFRESSELIRLSNS